MADQVIEDGSHSDIQHGIDSRYCDSQADYLTVVSHGACRGAVALSLAFFVIVTIVVHRQRLRAQAAFTGMSRHVFVLGQILLYRVLTMRHDTHADNMKRINCETLIRMYMVRKVKRERGRGCSSLCACARHQRALLIG